MKQATLAELLGVDRATISRWESRAHEPDANAQHQALAAVGASRVDDTALRRLVERSADCVHLIEEASHVCLAYSPARARDWHTSGRAMLGRSLWPFATDEIRMVEGELAEAGWWDVADPAPKVFTTRGATNGAITISAGGIMWERVYLTDGTPARLVTGC